MSDSDYEDGNDRTTEMGRWTAGECAAHEVARDQARQLARGIGVGEEFDLLTEASAPQQARRRRRLSAYTMKHLLEEPADE